MQINDWTYSDLLVILNRIEDAITDLDCTETKELIIPIPEIYNSESSLGKELQEFLEIPGYTYTLDKDLITGIVEIKIDTITIDKGQTQVKK